MINDPLTRDDLGRSDEFLFISVHEAGHAVIAHRLGMGVDEVLVVVGNGQDEETGGHVLLRDHADKDECWPLFFCAGAAAEKEFEWRRARHDQQARWRGDVEPTRIRPNLFPTLSSVDQKLFNDWLSSNYYSGVSRKKVISTAQREAGALVREHWGAIIDLAVALNDVSTEKAGKLEARLDSAAFLAVMKK